MAFSANSQLSVAGRRRYRAARARHPLTAKRFDALRVYQKRDILGLFETPGGARQFTFETDAARRMNLDKRNLRARVLAHFRAQASLHNRGPEDIAEWKDPTLRGVPLRTAMLNEDWLALRERSAERPPPGNHNPWWYHSG